MADLVLDSLNRLLGPYLGNPNTALNPGDLPDLIRSVGVAIRDAAAASTGDTPQPRSQPQSQPQPQHQPQPTDATQPAAQTTPPATEAPIEAVKKTRGKRQPKVPAPVTLPPKIAYAMPAAAAAAVETGARKRGRPPNNPAVDAPKAAKAPKVVKQKSAAAALKKAWEVKKGWTVPTPPVAPEDTYSVNDKGEQVVICLDTGYAFKVLKRRLSEMKLAPEDYRAKWGLPADYPMHPPQYGEKRKEIAKAQHAARAAAK